MKKLFNKKQEPDEDISEIKALRENVIQTGMPEHVEDIALKVMLVLYPDECEGSGLRYCHYLRRFWNYTG